MSKTYNEIAEEQFHQLQKAIKLFKEFLAIDGPLSEEEVEEFKEHVKDFLKGIDGQHNSNTNNRTNQ